MTSIVGRYCEFHINNLSSLAFSDLKFVTNASDGDGDEGDANNEVMILAAE